MYSHTLAFIADGILNFPEDKLPSVNLTYVMHPNIDRILRAIADVDLLSDIFSRSIPKILVDRPFCARC